MTTRNVLATTRRESIRQAAYLLADSGGYADWQAVEGNLCIRYGVLETRRLFVDLDFCQSLKRRCAAAQDKRLATGAGT
jgi:hypothetical protein